MPGLPIGNLSDADALNHQINQAAIPSREPQAVFYDLKRMPLHPIAAANRYNDASSAFPVNPSDNQVLAGFATSDDKSLTINREPADNFVAQFVPGINGSADSEHDLAAMVHDFMENGSYGSDIPDSSDGENGLPNCPRLFETLQALKFNVTSIEKELLSVLLIFFPSIKEADLFCLKSGAECKGACIRQMLVKHLRRLGYDAAICSSKWSNSGKVPGDYDNIMSFRSVPSWVWLGGAGNCLPRAGWGPAVPCSQPHLVRYEVPPVQKLMMLNTIWKNTGEYEYIDVFFKGEKGPVERVIVDVDFQSQFEIARPTHSYIAALKFLPIFFVGSEEKLTQMLQVMAEAAKMSLKQNSMPLPPWRTLDYMNAKWMSPFERSAADGQGIIGSGQGTSQWREHTRTKQCMEQLRHLKLCITTEIDKNYIPKPVNLERNRVMYFAKTRRLSTGFAIS